MMKARYVGNIHLRKSLPLTLSNECSHDLRLDRFEAAKVFHPHRIVLKERARYLTGVKGDAALPPMSVFWYALFLLIGYRLLMIIFGFSTYHGFAMWSLPLLAAFAVLQGYLLYRFRFHGFFLWHLAIMITLFVRRWRSESSLGATHLSLIEDDDDREFVRLSQAATKGFYWLSAILYLVVFSVAYLYFLNVSLQE